MEFDDFLDKHFKQFFDDAHDIEHTKIVTNHCYLAVKDLDLPYYIKTAIIFAGTCHEINDHKFVLPENRYNLTELLIKFYPDIDLRVPPLIEEMVELVSCSKNGDSYVSPTWKAIPRYADRLEAIGEIGIQRCLEYSKKTNRPIYNEYTKRVYSIEDIKQVATKERYESYCKGLIISPTSIDHFYDKILHIDIPEWMDNKYLKDIASERKAYQINWIIEFWKNN